MPRTGALKCILTLMGLKMQLKKTVFIHTSACGLDWSNNARYFFEQDYMSLRTGLAFTFDFVDVPTAKRNPVPMVPKPGQQVRAEL